MDNLDFSEEEIQEQLALLGYRNIPTHRLHEFKQDLDELIRRGEWKTLASPTQTDVTRTHPASAQPSPPAYTKEKVSQSYFQGSDEGFFLHPSKTFHESQLHTTSQNRRCVQQQGNCDSYARHSVAPKLQLPSGAPSRRQVEQDPEDALHPSFTDSYTSPDSQGRRLIKRKVLRKHEGQSLVCDESFYSEDSDAASCLEDGLAELHVSSSTQRDFETENEDVTGHSSDEDRISLSAFESYISGMTDSQSDCDLRPKPKSFIRPVMNQQNVKKTDPVAKYFQYKQFWETFKLPGEKDRRALRWEIRDRLAYEPPPKPRRVLVPNTYIVPTEKKRSALRWEIRSDLANGLLPHKFND
nr:PREDICTED: hydrolethalus syndrome protein 1 [Paralichthys olivaceus]XP_019961979.1 PREDICTED: hydrolethalus syndrome protein 1 [Paralichthys olivaceus]